MWIISVASIEIGLSIYAENTQYKVTFREGSARQNHNVKFGDKSFKIEEQFKYLERTLTIQNSNREEFKS